MKTHVKNFLIRGLMFGGFGPIVLGIIYAILESTIENFSLSGTQVLIAIISTYVIAFVQAGATVFKEIERLSTLQAFGIHLISLYLVYVLAYLVNAWIPFEPMVLLIFTAIFLAIFLVIWVTVFLTVKLVERRMNAKLG